MLKEKEQENRIGKLKIKELRRLEKTKAMPALKLNINKSSRESLPNLPSLPIRQSINPYEGVERQTIPLLDENRGRGRNLSGLRASIGGRTKSMGMNEHNQNGSIMLTQQKV